MRPRVLITRPQADAAPLAGLLEERGFEVVSLPTVSVDRVEEQTELHAALRHFHAYGWILFTSRNAVQIVLDEISRLGLSIPPAVKVGAVGPRTAADLAASGVTVDCVPSDASAVSLARALIAQGVGGTSVLLPAGDRARTELPEALRDAGANVDVVTVYRTSVGVAASPAEVEQLRAGEIDVVALASPSAFAGLVSLLGDDVSPLRRVRLVCIGPTTASAVREAGFEPAAVAAPHTVEGLVDAIANLEMTGRHDDRAGRDRRSADGVRDP